MKQVMTFFLIVMMLLPSSCAPQSQKSVVKGEETVVSEEAETIESPSREAVFVYGNQTNLPKRIVLAFTGEPVLLPSGYVRLVGVVSGGKPMALLEIGGRGLALGEGESVDGYRVSWIDCDHVTLERRK